MSDTVEVLGHTLHRMESMDPDWYWYPGGD